MILKQECNKNNYVGAYPADISNIIQEISQYLVGQAFLFSDKKINTFFRSLLK